MKTLGLAALLLAIVGTTAAQGATAATSCTTCHAVPQDYSHLGVQAATRDLDCTTGGCHDAVTTGESGKPCSA